MAGNTRDIRRRIRSITNTRKITKAMELVSGTKMRRAVKRVLETRSYATRAWSVVRDLAQKTDPGLHVLLQERPRVKKIAAVVMTSNRGLCGGFNRQMIEQTSGYIRQSSERYQASEVELFLVGKKSRELSSRLGYRVAAEFPKQDVATGIGDITPLAKMLVDGFIQGTYDRVVLIYTDYYSALKQTPSIRQLLPLSAEDDELGSTKHAGQAESAGEFEYLFEPSPDAVLDYMLYRLIEMQIYQALLESDASEHSARMMAMRNASDAAVDMIDDLTLTYNQARQAAITAEIADIAGGKAAVE